MLSLVILLNRHCLGHRSTYIPLHIALIFSALQNAAGFVANMLESNSAGLPSPNALFAFLLIENFLFFWSYPLLFLAFSNLTRDRFNAVNATVDGTMGRMNRIISISSLSILLLLSVFATTAAALQTDYEHFALYGLLDNSESAEDFQNGIEKRVNSSRDMLYVFDSLWIVSAIIIGVSAISLHKSMKKASAVDKVCSE